MIKTTDLKKLSNYIGIPLRIKNNYVEGKKGNCWGIYCSLAQAEEGIKQLKINKYFF